jgi:hypothetical protein
MVFDLILIISDRGLTRPMRDKRKAISYPRGLNHLSRPPRVSFPPIWKGMVTCFSTTEVLGRVGFGDPRFCSPESSWCFMVVQ